MKLVVAVVQGEDAERTVSALNDAGVGSTRVASTGGFLRQGNVTLLVGVDFEVVVSAVTALAALGALYFAWRTVVEARGAAAEARRDHLAHRLETLIDLVSQVRLSNRNANRVLSEMYQDRQRPLAAATTAVAIPKTIELSERKFTAAGWEVDEGIATDALAELRAVALGIAS